MSPFHEIANALPLDDERYKTLSSIQWFLHTKDYRHLSLVLNKLSAQSDREFFDKVFIITCQYVALS